MAEGEYGVGGEQFARQEQGAAEQQFALGNPFDFVAGIRALMEQAREGVQRRGFSEFDPPFWMHDKLIEVAGEMGDRNDEVRRAIYELSTAYGIAAYSQFSPMQKNRFRENLRSQIRARNIGSVTLSERQRELLGYITAATDTPFDPNQTEYQYSTVLTQPDITEEEMEEDPRYNTW